MLRLHEAGFADKVFSNQDSGQITGHIVVAMFNFGTYLSRIAGWRAGLASVVLLAGVGGGYESCTERSKPRIWMEKILDSTGGKYSIHGSGFKNGETVSLTIQNAPLMRPSGWHLGNTLAIEGAFSFQTEGFRCVRVDEENPRENYRKQRVVFVATGMNSGLVATAVDSAGEVFVCR